MRSLRLRDGMREGTRTLADAGRLIKAAPASTLELGLVLALIPALVRAYLIVRANAPLLALWTNWVGRVFAPGQYGSAESLVSLVTMTLRQSGSHGLAVTLLGLAMSLVLTPLLLTSLALIYNRNILPSPRAAVNAATMAGRNVRSLILVALACMVAEWLVRMVPSIASGLLSLLAELLSWIPLLGTVARALAVVLSLLISLATDFAVVIIFCYVWICAACEGISGFGALVRSWQLTRNQTHRTVASLLMLTLLRLLAVVAAGLLWLVAGRPAGVPIAALVYATLAIGAVSTVVLGAIASALYQQRPLNIGPQPGQFRQSGPSLDTMKRANID